MSVFLAIALALATSGASRVMRLISSSVTIGLLAKPQTPLWITRTPKPAAPRSRTVAPPPPLPPNPPPPRPPPADPPPPGTPAPPAAAAPAPAAAEAAEIVELTVATAGVDAVVGRAG